MRKVILLSLGVVFIYSAGCVSNCKKNEELSKTLEQQNRVLSVVLKEQAKALNVKEKERERALKKAIQSVKASNKLIIKEGL